MCDFCGVCVCVMMVLGSGGWFVFLGVNLVSGMLFGRFLVFMCMNIDLLCICGVMMVVGFGGCMVGMVVVLFGCFVSVVGVLKVILYSIVRVVIGMCGL